MAFDSFKGRWPAWCSSNLGSYRTTVCRVNSHCLLRPSWIYGTGHVASFWMWIGKVHAEVCSSRHLPPFLNSVQIFWSSSVSVGKITELMDSNWSRVFHQSTDPTQPQHFEKTKFVKSDDWYMFSETEYSSVTNLRTVLHTVPCIPRHRIIHYVVCPTGAWQM